MPRPGHALLPPPCRHVTCLVLPVLSLAQAAAASAMAGTPLAARIGQGNGDHLQVGRVRVRWAAQGAAGTGVREGCVCVRGERGSCRVTQRVRPGHSPRSWAGTARTPVATPPAISCRLAPLPLVPRLPAAPAVTARRRGVCGLQLAGHLWGLMHYAPVPLHTNYQLLSLQQPQPALPPSPPLPWLPLSPQEPSTPPLQLLLQSPQPPTLPPPQQQQPQQWQHHHHHQSQQQPPLLPPALPPQQQPPRLVSAPLPLPSPPPQPLPSSAPQSQPQPPPMPPKPLVLLQHLQQQQAANPASSDQYGAPPPASLTRVRLCLSEQCALGRRHQLGQDGGTGAGGEGRGLRVVVTGCEGGGHGCSHTLLMRCVEELLVPGADCPSAPSVPHAPGPPAHDVQWPVQWQLEDSPAECFVRHP